MGCGAARHDDTRVGFGGITGPIPYELDLATTKMNVVQHRLIQDRVGNTVRSKGHSRRRPTMRSEGATGMARRRLVGGPLVVAAALLSPGVSSAAGHGKIHPHQFFAGSVNGSLGRPAPAIIDVACPGPVVMGRTGHPLSGQTVEVSRAIPTASNSGYTGNDATSISAFFGAPPPGAGPIGPVSFTRYGAPKPIPTSLNLPLRGIGLRHLRTLPDEPSVVSVRERGGRLRQCGRQSPVMWRPTPDAAARRGEIRQSEKRFLIEHHPEDNR